MKQAILLAMALTIVPPPISMGDDLEATLKYNAMENSWGYEKETEELKYNSFENNWSYEEPDAELKYNAFENSWEWVD